MFLVAEQSQLKRFFKVDGRLEENSYTKARQDKRMRKETGYGEERMELTPCKSQENKYKVTPLGNGWKTYWIQEFK